MFYCREQELQKLNHRYADCRFECVVIYGRRRVGKTALIKESCKDKPVIFFSALNATSQENLESLSAAILRISILILPIKMCRFIRALTLYCRRSRGWQKHSGSFS